MDSISKLIDFRINCCFSCDCSFDNSSVRSDSFFSSFSSVGLSDETKLSSTVFCSGSRPQFAHNAFPSFITRTPLQYGLGSLRSVAPLSNMSTAFFVSPFDMRLVNCLHKKI